MTAFAQSGRKDRPRIHRHSKAAGREGLFWRRTSRQDVRAIVFAARRYELAQRAQGCPRGPIGHVGLEILELFANLVDFRTGQLDPSLATLQRMLKRSKDAIVRALKALRTHGFLDWLRRYVPTGNEGRGPQVQQTSNAYRLSLPAAAKRLIGQRFSITPPPPEDDEHRREEREHAIEAHAATLSLAELPLFRLGADTALGQVLARLGAAIERESGRQDES